MSQLFMSHANADEELAVCLATALEHAGHTTWYYKRDSVPGVSYLLQIGRAIKDASAFIIIVSKDSLASPQVSKEVVRAHEEGKPFIPLLRGLTHVEFQSRQDEWRAAMGAATSVAIPEKGVLEILPKVERGLAALGIDPSAVTKTNVSDEAAVAEETTQAISALRDEQVALGAGQTMRVVLVEDVQWVRELCARVLRESLCAVREAADVAEGMTAIEEFSPHLLVTDVVLPNGSGLEIVSKIRCNPRLKEMPCLIVSGYADERNRWNISSRQVANPLSDFLQKPYSVAMLLKRIAHLMKNNREYRQYNVSRSVGDITAPRLCDAIVKGDLQWLWESTSVFSDQCRSNLATHRMSEMDVLTMVECEFRSHTNYLRFDLENYPLPLQSGYILYISKTGKQITFTGMAKCTGDQAKLASWSDVLSVYRRASRLAYRSDPQALILRDGALYRAVATHADLRRKIVKHFTVFDGLPLEVRIMQLGLASGSCAEVSQDTTTDEIAFHVQASVRADDEAETVAHALEAGDLDVNDAIGLAVTELERSLTHLHKIITAFPPIT